MNNKILIPQHVADAMRIQQQQDAQKQALAARERELGILRDKMKAAFGETIPITAPGAREKIRVLCAALLNMRDYHPPITFTRAEFGKLLSDVMLGEGESYEVKT